VDQDQISAANPFEFTSRLKKQPIAVEVEVIVHNWACPF
jgi:hypothetical protein